MSRAVIKRPQVTRDLAEQAVFIGRNNPEAANRFLHAAEDAFVQLARLPQMGSPRQFRNPALAELRMWRIPGFEGYLIFYRHLRMADAIELTIGQGAKPGTAALIALNCNRPLYMEDYQALGTAPYHCHHCHTGRCPVGITTQDPALMQRLDIDPGAERVVNLLRAMALEIQMLAWACGKAKVHALEPEDLRALTLDASMICGIPLVGTNRVFGGGPGWQEGHAVVGSTGRRRQP